MNLREHTVYLRCSTRRDLLVDGAIVSLMESICELTGTPFRSARDLGGHRQRPGAVQAGLGPLLEVTGLGVHVPARVQLSARPADDEPDRRVETQTLLVNAGEHPYTGNFHTAFDLRIPSARFTDDGFADAFVDWVRTAVIPDVSPWMGHAHDTDDTTIQNTFSRRLLKSGFGLEVADDTPWGPEHNPGVEVSRGDLRYQVSWLTLVGPEFRDDVGRERVEDLEPGRDVDSIEWIATTLPAVDAGEATDEEVALLRLAQSPLPPDTETMRQRQAAVRARLDLAARAGEKDYAMGYWDRRKHS